LAYIYSGEMARQIENDTAWVRHDTGIDSLAAGYRRQRHIILVSAIAFAIFVVAATGMLSWQARQRSLGTAETELRNLSVALSEVMARSLDSVDILLRSVAETVATGDLGDADFTRRLHDAMRERVLGVPSIRALVVFDAGGRMIAFSRWHPPPSIQVEDRDYFVALRDQPGEGLFVGVPTVNRVNGEWTINIARRLANPDGSFAGVALATLEPLYYEQVYAAINLRPGGTIAMFRGDGILLARHPHAEDLMGKQRGDTPIRRILGRSTEPVAARVVSTIDGEARIAAARYLPAFPIYLTMSQREDIVLAGWRGETLLLLAGMVAVLLVLGLLATRMLQQAVLREAAEREILAAKLRAEAASEAKTSFLANMSHELRTPLNAILGFSEMIRDRLHGADGATRYCEYAGDIHASGTHLLDLVNDVLDLSRIEAGRYQLHLEPIDLVKTVAACLSIVQSRAVAKRITIETDIAEEVAPIDADERAVKQVLLNLLSNAVKFSPHDGKIAVIARLSPGGDTELRVVDHGIGIAEEALARIFEPFGRGDHMHAQPEEGIGLGLSISRKLMSLHGGVLLLDSAIGIGTTAIIRFPAAPSQSSAALDPAAAASDAGSATPPPAQKRFPVA
jgi:two-component system, cell cycle sensor histidine kinase PleC